MSGLTNLAKNLEMDLEKLEQVSLARKIPIIGREKAKWLLTKLPGRKKILELGCANGYSGVILGSFGAELTTIEIDPKMAAEAAENFQHFQIKAKIIIGDVVEEIKKLGPEYDLIFIDFAKKKYLSILDDCLRLTKSGSLIIADNISMMGCQDFRTVIQNHPKLKTEIINIKDGLSLSEVL